MGMDKGYKTFKIRSSQYKTNMTYYKSLKTYCGPLQANLRPKIPCYMCVCVKERQKEIFKIPFSVVVSIYRIRTIILAFPHGSTGALTSFWSR